MKRCSLFWVLSLFVFVVLLLCLNSSSCYAYSFDDFVNFCNQLSTYSGANDEQKSCAVWVINNQNTIKNRFGTNINADSWVVWRGSSTGWGTYTRIAGFSGGSFNGWNNSIGLNIINNYENRFATTYIGRGGNWTNNDGSNMNFEFCLFNDSIASNVDFGYRIGNNVYDIFYPPIEYLEFVNDVENSAYNGNIFTYYIQGDFYSVDKIKIGSIVPNDSYYYEVRLKDSVTGIIKGTSFVALNTSPNTYYNDGALVIDNTGVYVVPRLLKYSQQYQLEITSYYGDGGDNLYEDIDWFIFLPFNAVISGDYILNLGSGDYTSQDSTNDIMGFLGNYTFPSGDIEGILNSNGSLLSGDLIEGINIPVLDGMKNYTLFDLLRAIGDCVGGSGDAYFDFQMHGETPTRIYASQFRTPDGALKTLISSFLVFFTFYFLLLQIRHVLEMLTTANIKGAIEYVDSSMDNMFYM